MDPGAAGRRLFRQTAQRLYGPGSNGENFRRNIINRMDQ